jgi:hypothetical protein
MLTVKDIYLRINLMGLILNLPFFSMTVIEPLNRRMTAPSAIKLTVPAHARRGTFRLHRPEGRGGVSVALT